jgi:uncharacterized membrane protein
MTRYIGHNHIYGGVNDSELVLQPLFVFLFLSLILNWIQTQTLSEIKKKSPKTLIISSTLKR